MLIANKHHAFFCLCRHYPSLALRSVLLSASSQHLLTNQKYKPSELGRKQVCQFFFGQVRPPKSAHARLELNAKI